MLSFDLLATDSICYVGADYGMTTGAVQSLRVEHMKMAHNVSIQLAARTT